MNKGVAVTGMGIISALGNGVEENFNCLIKSLDGLSFPEIIKSIHSTYTRSRNKACRK
jgi:3-oxoacyl-[acyl-carrier-protein] synthase-1